MREEFVTVATFPDPSVAHLARQHLEASGIRGYLADENMDPIFGNAIGWVKLQVAREDAIRATAVLDAKMPPEPPPSEDIMVPEVGIARRDQFTPLDPDDEPEEQERRRAAMLDEKVTPEPDTERPRLAESIRAAALVGMVVFFLVLVLVIYGVLASWLD